MMEPIFADTALPSLDRVRSIGREHAQHKPVVIAGYHNPLTATGGIGTGMRMISRLFGDLHVVCVDSSVHGPHCHIHDRHRVSPLDISGAADQFYRMFCKSYLWPVLHEEDTAGDVPSQTLIEHAFAFASAYSQKLFDLVDKAVPEPVIWFNDYSMLPVAAHFRKICGDRFRTGLSIRCCFGVTEPPRLERDIETLLLEGLRSVDVLTVHRARDRSYLLRLLQGSLQDSRQVAPTVRVVPMGSSIDYWRQAGQSRDASALAARTRDNLAALRTVLAVSRLETHKAIDLELAVFDRLLRDYTDLRGRVQLVRVTPVFEATTMLPAYAALLERVRSEVRRINNLYGTRTWIPIDLRLGPALNHDQLAGYYRAADVLLVLSRSDGFNHVSFEAILAKQEGDPPLALMLSNTGSSDYLAGAHARATSKDPGELARQLAELLCADLSTRRVSHERLLTAATRHNVRDWLYEILGAIAGEDRAIKAIGH